MTFFCRAGLAPTGKEKYGELLKQLRETARGNYQDTDFLNAFAEFCPKGVARHLIKRLEMAEFRRAEAK